ncbi:MAG: hypothetical protein H7Z72_04210 [Bacteroidetes bacterium]|nr:hypothetical protein [Fibrella sp.]
MKAYNETDIRNQVIVDHAERWQRQRLLTNEQLTVVRLTYPFRFRNGSFFIDIGLFVFTLVAASGSFGLLAITVGELVQDNRPAQSVLCLLIAVLTGLLTNTFTQKGTYYRNGVDNALILVTTAFLIAAINLVLPSDLPLWLNCLVDLPILLAVVWYYGDLLITLATLIVFYTMIFSGMLEFSLGQSLLPFVLMIVSGALYLVIRRFPKHTRSLYYTDALTLTEWAVLTVLAASGNYYVVRELNGLLMTPTPAEAPEIALPSLFWALTFGIPVFYLTNGLRQKNRLLLILGLIGLMAAVATVRAYYVWAPLSVYLAMCGSVLFALAAVVIRALRPARNGFTDTPDDESPREFWGDAQTLTAIQGVSGTQPPEGVKFGGGNFGGGGAEGKY